MALAQNLVRQAEYLCPYSKATRGNIEVTFSVTEQPPTGISSRAISGTFKEMTGVYTLAREDGGVRLDYSGRLVPEFRLPPLIGTAAVKVAVEKQFGALVREIQRRAALRIAPAQ